MSHEHNPAAADQETAGRLVLPPRPPDQTSLDVAVWAEPVVIPTYEPFPPDQNPMFLERRVYQGSSGRVYPLPITDRVSDERVDRSWQAIHLENRYLRLMVLPELGGRVHVAQDRSTGYDFVYRQNVIKPALVGLAGPWISGGIEFNWPQHHRPSTYQPLDWTIEREAEGSATAWCSEHEPMLRMKGMHGVQLRPDSALIELRVRLYNRTQFLETFLWWTNIARPRPRPIPSCLPTRGHPRRRPRQASDLELSRGARPLLRRRLRRQGRTGCRPALVSEHPGANVLHGIRHAGGRLRRLRPCRRCGVRARGRSHHRSRQEAVDLGRLRVRARMGPEPHGRRRAVHRAHGWGVHGQPAGLQPARTA